MFKTDFTADEGRLAKGRKRRKSMAGRLPLAGAGVGWKPWRDAVVGG